MYIGEESMTKFIDTKKEILLHAKDEFLEKGFVKASMRNIAKKTGITTGAIYGIFQNKESMFDAIVENIAKFMIDKYENFTKKFFDSLEQNLDFELININTNHINFFINYIYDNYEECKLLICCSEGTKYKDLIDIMVNKEVGSTIKFINMVSEKEILDETIIHIITSSYLKAVFEFLEHDLSREEAIKQSLKISKFFRAGWSSLLSK